MLFATFLFGLLIGSFLNVCIYRVPRQESIVFPASHCACCGTPIKHCDLIPVVSFLLLRGKCRSCNCAISARYPLVELATATLLCIQNWRWGSSVSFVLFAALTAVLIVVTMVDYDHQIIPDRFIVIIAILGLCYLFAVRFWQAGSVAVLDSIIGCLLGGGLFFLIAVVSKGGMGGGDIKLVAALGLWFGWKQLLLLIVLSFVLGAIISVFLLLRHKKTGKDGIPFGPFIALAAYLVSLFGQEWLLWYSQWLMMS